MAQLAVPGESCLKLHLHTQAGFRLNALEGALITFTHSVLGCEYNSRAGTKQGWIQLTSLYYRARMCIGLLPVSAQM